ncbi:MAG TPA: SLC13 family permease, partial [Clostridia bacterium]|nr:SLC13 family permease [Clostridia bacterium]
MTFQIGLLLLLIGVAMVFFWWERLPAEVVALGLLLALVFTGLLPVDLAFEGASNDAVVMIFGLLVLTAALQRTGVIELAGRTVLRHAGEDPNRLLLIIMIASAVMGAFMSNTASTAFFVPVVMGVARKAGISPSRLLMPLAFSSILTSSVTLVSTSTNLVVSGMIGTYRMEPMGMFELTPVGIPIAVAGLIYMFFLGRRLIPERASAGEMTDRFGLRPYLTEIVILPESPLANKTLAEARVSQELGLTVLGFIRDKTRHLTPTPDLVLRAGDVLIAEGNQQDIVQIKDVAGVEIKADVKLSDPDLQTKDMALAEAILLPGSPLINRTLKEYRFRERTGAQVLGLNHQGRNVTEKISRRRLRMGDVLLVQGRPQSLNRMHEGGLLQLLHPLEAMEERRPKLEHAPWAIGIFVVVLAMAALDFVPLTMAVMLGVLLVFLTGCITPEQAYKQVEWKALLL